MINNKKEGLVKLLGLMLFIILINISIAEPPVQRTVRGTVYDFYETSQVESGLVILINNTILDIVETTETYGPPTQPGGYSGVINSSVGDLIYALVRNDTNYGYKYGIMGQSQVVLDINMNISRDPEAYVNMWIPTDNFEINSSMDLNITVNITILGSTGNFCNLTLSFDKTGVINFISDSYTHNLGTINHGQTINSTWNIAGGIDGSTNITVVGLCRNSGVNFENLNIYTVYNITNTDVSAPIVYPITPVNHSRQNNPILFYYNVSDGSDIYNCSLAINNITVNLTNTPDKNIWLNLTNDLPQKYNSWEINCTDDSIRKNQGTTGLINITRNDYPTLSIITDTPINLLAASNKTVFCNGTITDYDSSSDITNVNASLYFTGFSSLDVQNNSVHYINSSCTTLNPVGNNIDYQCAFDVEYYANNGTWYCNVTAIDTINATNTTEDSLIINDLLAIGINPTVINFGQLSGLQISPNDIIVNISNYGNVNLDVDLFAYAIFENDNSSMDCTKGNISLEYERFALSEYTDFSVMTPVNNTINSILVDLNLSKKVYGGADISSKSTYWKLQIPYRTGGICNGKIVFSAVSS